jgi:hypothetical protein
MHIQITCDDDDDDDDDDDKSVYSGGWILYPAKIAKETDILCIEDA